MADEIFISYAREQRDLAEHLAKILQLNGYSVWFDTSLIAGHDFRQQLQSRISASKVLIVLWCKHSVQSAFVHEEVDLAKTLGILVPVKIEPCKLVVGDRLTHHVDLTAWNRMPRSDALDPLFDALEAKIRRPPTPDAKGLRDYENAWRRILGLTKAWQPEPAFAGGSTGAPPKHRSLRGIVSKVSIGCGLALAIATGGFITKRLIEQRAVEAAELQPTEPDTSAPHTRTPAALSVFQDILQDGSKGPQMVVMPAGKFLMGSAASDTDRYADEGPQHAVAVKPFALSRTEVTFEDYDHFARATGRALADDAAWGRGTRPVIKVSWQDAAAYAQWLSAQTGAEYRLPSEAEWEYAARAGTITPYSTGEDILSKQANFSDSGIGRTQPVGLYPANLFGLHDMQGNVYEWTSDCWHANYSQAPLDGTTWLEQNTGNCARRVIRGGSWYGSPLYLRSAYRSSSAVTDAEDYIGLRLARTL